jgi:hypothetical protein
MLIFNNRLPSAIYYGQIINYYSKGEKGGYAMGKRVQTWSLIILHNWCMAPLWMFLKINWSILLEISLTRLLQLFDF